MLSKFFINRPIVAMVIAILTVIVGLIAMRSLPLAQLPEIVPPQVNVSTTYTGADGATCTTCGGGGSGYSALGRST